jgi:hypothetical protein
MEKGEEVCKGNREVENDQSLLHTCMEMSY